MSSPRGGTDWWRCVACAVVTMLCAVGMVTGQSAKPVFAVVSIKRSTASSPNGFTQRIGPGLFTVTNMPVSRLIVSAYELLDFQVVGGPGWIQTDRFDVTAKTEDGTPATPYAPMLRSLLEDRFKLVAHSEKRRLNAFVLTTERADARKGEFLERAPDDCDTPAGQRPPLRGPRKLPPGGASGMVGFGECAEMTPIARSLSRMLGAPVVDKTGLAGKWDYSLAFAPAAVSPDGLSNPDLPGFSDAVHEQWGLKVERQSTEVDVLVIESIQPPTEN